MKELSVFEEIVAGEREGHVIWQDSHFAAILTIDPYNEGHTLVVPKKNVGDDLFELDDEVYMGLMAATKKVGKVLKEVFQCERLIVWVRGFEVAHVHVHLIPSDPKVDLISDKRGVYKEGDLSVIYKKIINHIQNA